MSATKNAVTGAVPKQGPVITDWRPEDSHFWAAGGKAIATRNLWISIPALLLAFAVWMVWSTVIVRLTRGLRQARSAPALAPRVEAAWRRSAGARRGAVWAEPEAAARLRA